MDAETGSNIVRVKNHNRQAILLQLLRTPLSRVELAQKLHLSSMTVSNLVTELLEDGWLALEETAVSQRNVGRPRKYLHLNPQAGYVIGVHIGIGTVRLGLVNLTGNLIIQARVIFDIAAEAATVLHLIAQEIATLRQQCPAPATNIFGIGVGASGLIDAEKGICVEAPGLQWQAVQISAQLEQLTGLPVVVENNVRAMALGEAYFGQGQDVDALAFIYGRVGVGAGFIMNRSLFRGTQAGAGEIGHTIVMPQGGSLCRCGQTGCLETLITQPILEQQIAALNLSAPLLKAKASDSEEIRFAHILNLAQNGQPLILEKLKTIGQFLGIALINLVNTLNPERIIIGGMYFQAADIFLPILEKMVQEKAFASLGHHVKISATQFGLEAGIIGAAGLALLELFYKKEAPNAIRRFS